MSDSPEKTLAHANVDFDSAFAYALSPDMRRLIIVFLAGWLLFPLGLALFFDPRFISQGSLIPQLLTMILGLAVVVVAGALLFGGLIGALFKTIADANVLAETAET